MNVPVFEKAEVVVELVPVAFVKNKLVNVPVVPKMFVVVAFVVVERSPVKFCNVEEPSTSKLAKVVKPEATLRVPVKLAAEDIVWPLINPDVIAPDVIGPVVSVPIFPLVA